MCRWAAYTGEPIFLSDIISDPEHSLIEQSRDAEKCKTATNADGFGIAWYGEREMPGLYRDTYPAWSDPNLISLAEQVKSRLFMAHVRASTGMATSRNNCHPFECRNWTFMHNGQVGGFMGFRKSADMMISEPLYPDRKGATDSEAMFLVAMGDGLANDPKAAMERSVGTFQTLAQRAGILPHMRFTAALSDGESLFAIRYASDARAPSLFYRWSESRLGWAVVSEPFEGKGDWCEVPAGSFCTFSPEGCEITPFEPVLAA